MNTITTDLLAAIDWTIEEIHDAQHESIECARYAAKHGDLDEQERFKRNLRTLNRLEHALAYLDDNDPRAHHLQALAAHDIDTRPHPVTDRPSYLCDLWTIGLDTPVPNVNLWLNSWLTAAVNECTEVITR